LTVYNNIYFVDDQVFKMNIIKLRFYLTSLLVFAMCQSQSTPGKIEFSYYMKFFIVLTFKSIFNASIVSHTFYEFSTDELALPSKLTSSGIRGLYSGSKIILWN
jgi:hypothetical protein